MMYCAYVCGTVIFYEIRDTQKILTVILVTVYPTPRNHWDPCIFLGYCTPGGIEVHITVRFCIIPSADGAVRIHPLVSHSYIG